MKSYGPRAIDKWCKKNGLKRTGNWDVDPLDSVLIYIFGTTDGGRFKLTLDTEDFTYSVFECDEDWEDVNERESGSLDFVPKVL